MRTKLKIGLLPYLNRTPATIVLLDTFQYCHLNYKKKKIQYLFTCLIGCLLNRFKVGHDRNAGMFMFQTQCQFKLQHNSQFNHDSDLNKRGSHRVQSLRSEKPLWLWRFILQQLWLHLHSPRDGTYFLYSLLKCDTVVGIHYRSWHNCLWVLLLSVTMSLLHRWNHFKDLEVPKVKVHL